MTSMPPSEPDQYPAGPQKRYQGWSLQDRDPEAITAMMPLWQWLYQYYFRVDTDGWQHIPPDGPLLFVGSHNGGLATPDLPMFMYDWYRRFGVEQPIYGLMHPKVWQVFPNMARVAATLGAVRAHPKMALAALAQGAHVLVYPGGAQDSFRPHRLRHRIHFAGRTGFIKLALRQGVTIVPLVSWGAHDSLIVLDNCYDQAKTLHRLGMPWLFDTDPEVFPIYLGLPWGVALGALPNIPLPVQIHTRVGQPIRFSRYGRETLRDPGYVMACHDMVVTQMQALLDDLVAAVAT